MYRLAYRNFGSHESLVVNHSVAVSGGGGVRWYEIQSPNSSPVLAQQGTYAPDSSYRWMGSVAMDKIGDLALGYSFSSGAVYPGVAFAGRVPSDPAGALEAETVIMNGSGSQTGTLSRWGDYSAMTVDPVDDCTFWYTQEYLVTNGTWNWNTRITNFKFPGCASGNYIGFYPGTLNFGVQAVGTTSAADQQHRCHRRLPAKQQLRQLAGSQQQLCDQRELPSHSVGRQARHADRDRQRAGWSAYCESHRSRYNPGHMRYEYALE
jgi:hypothetical protein